MNICVIGTGYVGLVAGTCLADIGNNVICIDSNKEKINELNNGKVPIYEPGLEELIEFNKNDERLKFSDDLKDAVKTSDVCFITVGTPQSDAGSCDLSSVYTVIRDIAEYMNGYKLIVNKSTVPVGTMEKIYKLLKENTKYNFDIVYNPEFLKQGDAVKDFLSPDRIIIGAESKKAISIMQEIYSPFMRTANRIILMDIKSAEMTKYASNAFLATKISFINEIANICENIGADVEMVRLGISTDERIGRQFLFPGIGYGGSCFPKDVNALIATAEKSGCGNSVLKAVNSTNIRQRELFFEKILKYYNNNIKNKTFAVWGLAFKPKTNDMREAPSITIINRLLENGAVIKAFDPKAIPEAKKIWGNKIKYTKDAYNALIEADALLLITEWNEFRFPNLEKMKKIMKEPLIFDGRNQYNKEKLIKHGFKYIATGR